MFTKIIREITIAARHGGGNPESNPRLRKAIDDARNANMPQANVTKAIQRGTGELPGVNYEECVYEGYGPGGVAILVEGTTDNKNRSTSEIRKIFNRYGGNLGENGCVGWMFSQKGLIQVDKKKIPEEDLLNLAIESGAEDFTSDDEDVYEIITAPENLEKVKNPIEKIGIELAEVTMVPKTYIKLDGKQAEQMLKLMDALEEHEDVKKVYANFDIPKKIMETVQI